MMNIHDKVIAALKRQTTMEKAIEYLRTLNFDFYETFVFGKGFPFKEAHLKYSWMGRRFDQKTELPDVQVLIGIKMWGKKNSKVVIYLHGSWLETIRVPWKDKADINFRKIVVKLKFPDYLNYEERRTWRTEYHKQKKNPKRIPTEWYLKILPDIKFI